MKQIGQLEPIKKCPRDQLVFSQYTLSFFSASPGLGFDIETRG